MKRCPVCGLEKPKSEFAKDQKRTDGLRGWCRPCDSQKASARYRKNSSSISLRNREKAYGLSPADFLALLELQSGRCRICDAKFRNGKDTQVDHCHVTGRIRGLLCMGCNTGLGKFGECPARLQAAIDYLTAAQTQTTLPNLE